MPWLARVDMVWRAGGVRDDMVASIETERSEESELELGGEDGPRPMGELELAGEPGGLHGP